MEVAVAEEKKKIFRARKTMKISDRQQLESLHSTLLTGAQTLSSSPSPPLLNGRHKEDAQKTSEKEKNDSSDSNSHTTPSLSPASRGSPTALLSLNLSPSPPMSQSPKAKEDNSSSPTSPFYPIDFDLKIMEEEGKSGAPSLPSNGLVEASAEGTEDKYEDEQTAHETVNVEKQKDGQATTGHPAMISLKDSVLHSPTSPMSSVTKTEKERSSPEPGHTDPMEVVSDTTAAETLKSTPAVQTKVEKPSSPKASTSSSPSCPSSSSVPGQDQEVKDEKGQEPGEMNTGNIKEGDKNDCKDKKTTLLPKVVEKMEVDTVKVETKKEKEEAGQPAKPSRPSSTPPAQTERSSISGLKRALSEGSDNDGLKLQQDAKKPKVEGVELEAQLELKITAKASSRLKLEKVVQQLVGERLMDLQITVFDKSLQELKDRVEKIDCATKHQTALNSLQTKIARLVKKFGEANQASENKRKQEAVAASAAAAAATAAAAAAAAATTTTKAVAAPSTLSTQRPFRTSLELKQTPTLPALSGATALSTSSPAAAYTSAPTTMVSQTPILQLITSTANAGPTLAKGITTQSTQGTLLVKTAPGSGMVGQGQQFLIQVPLSMTSGQAGALVNLPVSSFSGVSPLNKAKTTTATTAFILKPAPGTTMPTLQTAPSQLSPAQISLARAMYPGGAGGICAPNAGVSVTTARTPAQLVPVAGAVSSSSSPAASGPAATGSAAPGPPQGTSMTSKTDNQVASSAATKATVPVPRPKGSVIDLTEDDDDVQVTGVKNAPVTPSSAPQRPSATVPNSTAPRSSPQSNQNIASNPQMTIHHRPPLDSPLKNRTVTTTTAMQTRVSAMALPPLPSALLPAGGLPPEAAQTLPPQQPQLKLVPSQTGIVLSWCVTETDRTCAAVDSYHLYAFHQDSSNSNSGTQQHWKKIGEVKALPLPMACTLTQFQSGSTYHFAVRARDIYGRYGSFCEPQCTNVITPISS